MTRKATDKLIGGEWSLASTLLLASVLIIVGICVHLVSRTLHAEKPLVSSGRLTKQEAVFKNLDVTYPVLRSKTASEMMRSYAEQEADRFLQKVAQRKSFDGALSLTYTILHYDERTISVMFHGVERIAESETHTQHILNYDLKHQKRLQLNDLFTNTFVANAHVGRILHDYFKHHPSELYGPAELAAIKDIKLEGVQEFTLSADSLVLYLDPRRADQANGASVSIKKEILSPVLKRDFTDAKPDRIPENIAPATYGIDTLPPHEIVIDPNGKMLAFTFDDGPGNLTGDILDILKTHDARATFFMIGRQVPSHGSIVRRTVQEGNEIGNHSWSHLNFRRLTPDALNQQIDDTQRVIRDATGGYTPTRMRPPEGAYNQAVADYAQAHGLTIQLWNVDTLDWVNRDAQIIYERIMSSAADGRIILLHDIYPASVEAAKRAIADLKGQGYQLVTVSELDQYR